MGSPSAVAGLCLVPAVRAKVHQSFVRVARTAGVCRAYETRHFFGTMSHADEQLIGKTCSTRPMIPEATCSIFQVCIITQDLLEIITVCCKHGGFEIRDTIQPSEDCISFSIFFQHLEVREAVQVVARLAQGSGFSIHRRAMPGFQANLLTSVAFCDTLMFSLSFLQLGLPETSHVMTIGLLFQVQATCFRCRGRGFIGACSQCQGRGTRQDGDILQARGLHCERSFWTYIYTISFEVDYTERLLTPQGETTVGCCWYVSRKAVVQSVEGIIVLYIVLARKEVFPSHRCCRSCQW